MCVHSRSCRLRRTRLGRLFVTGLVTHGCVRATVQGALQLGYEVIVASDAHSRYGKEAERLVEDWNRRLGNAGAIVVSTAALVS